MRVEANKKNQPEKKESSNFKIEKSVFDSSGAVKNKDLAAPPPASGAFAKILDEARKSGADKNKTEDGKKDASDSAVKNSASDDEKDLDLRAERKKDLEEKNSRGEGDSEGDGDENSAAFARGAAFGGAKPAADVSVPAARAILHVADLERILSFVRAQSFSDESRILLALKNSVLEGLQIRLSLSESGNLKAEFLALNEQIKKQLKKRERELLDILRQRSTRFTSIDVLLLQTPLSDGDEDIKIL